MEINPAELSGTERYKLLIGGILPRPIAVVSSQDPAGQLNLAPFSFFNGVGSDPMTLLFCPANRPDGSEKDSLLNASSPDQGGTGEFVVNVAPDSLIEQIAGAAEPLEHGQSEFDFTGLVPASSQVVAAPRLAGSPLSYECRTRQILRLNPGAPGGANIVIGDVVHVFVEDELIDDRYRLDAAGLDLVGRMGGHAYARTRDCFELKAGKSALEEGRR
ncbi:flavin reductase family protein [bacterium]|nr:MAG: flavin reductase family protein [bacterium]